MLYDDYICFMFHLVIRAEVHDHISSVFFNHQFYDIQLRMPILLATTWKQWTYLEKSFENHRLIFQKMTLKTQSSEASDYKLTYEAWNERTIFAYTYLYYKSFNNA